MNQSLRRGPIEIEEQYGKGLQTHGHVFDAGDACARLELNSVLLKLNSGLVELISSFIKNLGRTKMQLDYEGLTALSDASRVQARNSLSSLSQRLSPPLYGHLGARAANDDNKIHKKKSRTADAAGKSAPRHRHKAIPEGEYYTISKQDSETQIALVRPAPRARRTLSMDSAKTGSSRTPIQKEARTGKASNRAARRSSSTGRDKAAPTPPMPLTTDDTNILQPIREAITTPVTASRSQQAGGRMPEAQNPPPRTSPGPTQHTAQGVKNASLGVSTVLELTAIPRRRPTVYTETMYTMTTASTKLGEIPMTKWTMPYDFAEAERLNTLAETTMWVNTQEPTGRKKPGLIKRLFGRKSISSGGEVIA